MKTRSVSSRSAARATTKRRGTSKIAAEAVTAERFDALADSGVDMTPCLNFSKARRLGREVQRVNVDFPVDLLAAIDREATRIGVTCQAFIKLRLADTLTK